MSLLILSADRSADRIGENLCQILNGNSIKSKSLPSIAAFCSSNELFERNSTDWEKIFVKSLKTNFLSTNDLLGFLFLFDIATTNSLHLKNLSSIESLVQHLQIEHPFQSTLTLIFHGQPENQLLTSALTCFNLNFLLSTIFSFVHGIVFYSVDQINEHQVYHSTIAENLAGIFRPVTSLREDSTNRQIRNVSVEFLQLLQHLLTNPNEKFVQFFVDPPVQKILRRNFQSALLIERGKPSLNQREQTLVNLDVWYSLEEHSSSRYLLVNSFSMIKDLLEKLLIQPYERKLHMNKAYFYWLMKKYSIEEKEFYRTNEFLREILT